MSFDRLKFIRVLGMTGSVFGGEALAALRRGQEMLKAAGLNWEQILTQGSGASSDAEMYRRLRDDNHRLLDENLLRLQAQLRRAQTSSQPDSSGWIEPQNTAEKLERCTRYKQYLTESEVEFAVDIAGWRTLTPRQTAVLDRIIAKLRNVVRLRGGRAA